MNPLTMKSDDRRYNGGCHRHPCWDESTSTYVVGRLTRHDGLPIDIAREHYETLIKVLNRQLGRSRRPSRRLSVLVDGQSVRVMSPDCDDTRRHSAPVSTILDPFRILARDTALPHVEHNGGFSPRLRIAHRQRVSVANAAKGMD